MSAIACCTKRCSTQRLDVHLYFPRLIPVTADRGGQVTHKRTKVTGMRLNRRQAISSATALSASAAISTQTLLAAETPDFKFNYVLASCMYGYNNVWEIVPEVARTGATAIDLGQRSMDRNESRSMRSESKHFQTSSNVGKFNLVASPSTNSAHLHWKMKCDWPKN